MRKRIYSCILAIVLLALTIPAFAEDQLKNEEQNISVVTEQAFVSDNKIDQTKAVTGDTLTVSFTSSKRVEFKTDKEATIEENILSFSLVSTDEEIKQKIFKYSASLKIKEGFCKEDKELSVTDFNIVYTNDESENTVETVCVNGKVNYIASPEITDISFVSDHEDLKTKALTGDTLTAAFTSNMEIEFDKDEPIKINDQEIGFKLISTDKEKKENIYKYEANFQIPENIWKEDKTLSVSAFKVTRKSDSEIKTCKSINISDNISFYADPIISDIAFASNNTIDETKAVDGDTVEATFKSNYELYFDEVKIADHTVAFYCISTDEEKEENIFKYKAILNIPEGFQEDDGPMAVSTFNVTRAKLKDITVSIPVNFNKNITYVSKPKANDINFSSNNIVDKTKAVSGDILTVRFSTDKEVTFDTVVIDESIFEFTENEEKGLFVYTGTAVVSDYDNDSVLTMPEITIRDKYGAVSKISSEDTITYCAAAVISDMYFISDHTEGNNKAIVGSTLTAGFTSDKEVTFDDPVLYDDVPFSFTCVSSEEEKGENIYKYQATANNIDSKVWTTDRALQFPAFDVKIREGAVTAVNITDIIDFIAYEKLEDPVITCTNSRKNTAVNGDTITVTWKSHKKFNISGIVTIVTTGLYPETIETEDGYIYKVEYTFGVTGIHSPKLWDGRAVNIDMDEIYFNQGNGYDDVQTTAHNYDFIYYEPVSTNSTITCDNPNAQSVVSGNTLTYTVKTNHAVKITGNVLIGGKAIALKQDESQEGYVYTGTLQVEDNTWNDLYTVSVDTSGIRLKDEYGNPEVEPEAIEDSFVFYKKLAVGENITELSFISSNSGSTKEGIQLAVKNDVLTIGFSTNRSVNINSCIIGGKTVEMISEDGMNWIGSTELSQLEDNKNVNVLINIQDIYGNPAVTLTEKDFDTIIFYDDILISLNSYFSNNADTSVVKNGESITVDFKTNHPANIVSAEIGEQKATISTDDGINFKARLDIKNNFSDLKEIAFMITVNDNAGNASKTLESASCITYYAPIELTGVTMHSTNNKNSMSYIKNGENINIGFKSNHSVSVSAIVNGETASVTGSNGQITVIGGIGNLSDQQNVSFKINASDKAGNTADTLTENNVSNKITYYAPITGQGSINASSSKTNGFVKNGDVISLNITTNHTTNGTNATIQTRDIGITGNSTSFTIPSDESTLPEGKIEWSISVDDAAGNTFTTGDTSSIIYDRTAPNIKIEPSLSGFTNQDVGVSVQFSDTNIDQDGLSWQLNNVEQIKGGTAGVTTYNKSITIKDEGTYTFTAAAIDKAGNSASISSGTIVIDKTNPLITTIDINLDDTPAYKTGLILAKHFNISDTYLRNIRCTLTGRTGLGFTKSWDISTGITDEGLIASSISADDMAENISQTVNYSFYVDGTSPKAIIKNKANNAELNTETKSSLAKNTTVAITLDNIWMGNEAADHFTELQVKDASGKVVKDLLGNGNINATEYKFTTDGDYSITLKAVDDVGNELESSTYQISIEKEASATKVATTDEAEKSGLTVAIIAAAVALAGGITVVLVIRKKKNSQDSDIEP